MSISISLTDNKNGLIYKSKGVICGSDFIRTEEDFFRDRTDLEDLKYVIIDHSEVTEINFSILELEKLASISRQRSKQYPIGFIAVLTNQNLIKTLSEIWGKYLGDIGWEYGIFREYTEMERWLTAKLPNDYHGFFKPTPFRVNWDDESKLLDNINRTLDIIAAHFRVEGVVILEKSVNGFHLLNRNSISDHDSNFPFRTDSREINTMPSSIQAVINDNCPRHIIDLESAPDWQESPVFSNQTKGFFGLPLHHPNGKSFGMLALFSKKTLQLSDHQKRTLNSLCELFESLLALKQSNNSLERCLKEIVNLQIALSTESKTDYLTGLYNRKNFFELSENELIRSRRKNLPLSFIFCDIDHFKKINDSLGHDAGDYVLVYIASLLKSNLRQYDVIWRWGGEEFLIMLPETGLSDALHIANKLKKSVEGTSFMYKHQEIEVTLSFGVSDVLEHEKIDRFLNRLDLLLFKAKKSGRNSIIHE